MCADRNQPDFHKIGCNATDFTNQTDFHLHDPNYAIKSGQQMLVCKFACSNKPTYRISQS